MVSLLAASICGSRQVRALYNAASGWPVAFTRTAEKGENDASTGQNFQFYMAESLQQADS